MRVDKKVKEDLKQYLEERLKTKKIPVIKISAPYLLDKEDIGNLKKKISILEGVEIVPEIDKKIMGGCIIRFGSRIIDLTIDSELKTLANTLYETA